VPAGQWQAVEPMERGAAISEPVELPSSTELLKTWQ
jgi:hypothetical protein